MMLPEVGSSIQFRHLKNVLFSGAGRANDYNDVTFIDGHIDSLQDFPDHPNVFFRSMTSITLLQAPFHQFYKN